MDEDVVGAGSVGAGAGAGVGAGEPLRFGVVGSGWRAAFFTRVARAFPERFVVTGVVTRSAERGAEVERTWGVPTARTVEELVTGAGGGRQADRPELVVTATPWEVTPDVVREVVAAGVPVLAETPPAPDVAGLRSLWSDVGATGLVQVAEHSPFMPQHAARAAAVDAGLLGTPTHVQVSSTHLYHAVSLVRRFLQAAGGPARGPAVVRAVDLPGPLLDPVSRDGWTGATDPAPATTTLATIDLGDGRSGLYDFTTNQWHNPLRRDRLVVRGSHGELVDDALTRWAGERTVLTSHLVRRQQGVGQDLDGFDLEHVSLDGRVLWRNAFLGGRFADDELAVAGLLAGCHAWLRGDAPPPYPLAEGCQDHLLGLAVLEAARTGAEVRVAAEAWA